MGSLKVVIGSRSDTEPPPPLNGNPIKATDEVPPFGSGNFGGFILRITDNESDKTWNDVKASTDITIPDGPDLVAISNAIVTAATAAVSAIPQPPDMTEIATAIAEAVEAAVSSLPIPPTPADIAAAIASA